MMRSTATHMCSGKRLRVVNLDLPETGLKLQWIRLDHKLELDPMSLSDFVGLTTFSMPLSRPIEPYERCVLL